MTKNLLHKEFLQELFQNFTDAGFRLEPSYVDPTIPELRGYNMKDSYLVFETLTFLTVGDYTKIANMFPMVIDIEEIEYKAELLSIMNEDVEDDRVWPASVAFSLTANGEPVSFDDLVGR